MARRKALRLLAAIGFQMEKDFWWLKVSNEKRVCVAFDVVDQCLGGRTSWVWQSAKLTEAPLFGYSGTTHVGAGWGTANKIIAITLERIFDEGVYRGLELERVKTSKLKAAITAALAT